MTASANSADCALATALIITDPAVIVRIIAVKGPVAVTVAMATLLLVHATVVKEKGDPSAAVAKARTSSESPTMRLLADADTWMVLEDDGVVVDSLQAVSRAAAKVIVRIFVIAERSAWAERRRWPGSDLPAHLDAGVIVCADPHAELISTRKFPQSYLEHHSPCFDLPHGWPRTNEMLTIAKDFRVEPCAKR